MPQSTSTLSIARIPIVDKQGFPTRDFLKWLQNVTAMTANLQLDGNLGTNSGGSIDPSTLAEQVANLDTNGILMPNGLDLTRAYVNKTLDNVNDGSTYARVGSVNVSHQVTTPSILPGAVTTSGQYLHTVSVAVSPSTWTQIASITITANGGVVIPICYFDVINQGGGSALNIQGKMYKGDNTGTVIWEDDYPTIPAGANMPITALGYDSSAPSGSQQYSVYVYSTVAFSVIAIYMVPLNAKV